jgi:hypothetical protein
MKYRGTYLFGRWVQLEGKKEKIIEAVSKGQPDFPDLLLSYIETALGVRSIWFAQANWLQVVELFFACLSKSPQIKIPLTAPNPETYKDDPWTYEGRTWRLYAHLLAQAYGWTLSEISQLHVGDALGMIQEVMVDKQLEKEFQYGLSEIAYPYNKQTKQSSFKPLDRPYWMRPELNAQRDIPRFTIPKSYMPEGTVIIKDAIPDEFLPKEIIH